jgi:uncharacterized protein
MLITQTLARELAVQERQIEAAVALLDSGATVPFISRYRKEATDGLDDTQLRLLEERLGYLRELEERRGVILTSIREQNQLTPELEAAILAADAKTRLEDLYLPYKPKRRTKAQIAREAGLAPLAHGLLDDPTQAPETLAAGFVNPDQGVPDAKAALDGARQILMEEFAENAELLAGLRDYLWDSAVFHSQLVEEKAEAGAKFRDYFDYREPLRQVPSHRALALFRGRNEGVLQLTLEVGDPAAPGPDPGERRVAAHFKIHDEGRAADPWLRETARWTWKIKLSLQMETELNRPYPRVSGRGGDQGVRHEPQGSADGGPGRHALHHGAGSRHPHRGQGGGGGCHRQAGRSRDHLSVRTQIRLTQSLKTLSELCQKHKVELISIGNGTASRETDRLVSDLFERYPAAKAAEDSSERSRGFGLLRLRARLSGVPGSRCLDARRRLHRPPVARPLAELVKIDPKSIGVGQYQHDVGQSQLARRCWMRWSRIASTRSGWM